uniref:Uncharacterized protein n=1 Tax=Ciona intestinalis TaxID=7719 RepID=H2XL06_CIOIN
MTLRFVTSSNCAIVQSYIQYCYHVSQRTAPRAQFISLTQPSCINLYDFNPKPESKTSDLHFVRCWCPLVRCVSVVTEYLVGIFFLFLPHAALFDLVSFCGISPMNGRRALCRNRLCICSAKRLSFHGRFSYVYIY